MGWLGQRLRCFWVPHAAPLPKTHEPPVQLTQQWRDGPKGVMIDLWWYCFFFVDSSVLSPKRVRSYNGSDRYALGDQRDMTNKGWWIIFCEYEQSVIHHPLFVNYHFCVLDNNHGLVGPEAQVFLGALCSTTAKNTRASGPAHRTVARWTKRCYEWFVMKLCLFCCLVRTMVPKRVPFHNDPWIMKPHSLGNHVLITHWEWSLRIKNWQTRDGE